MSDPLTIIHGDALSSLRRLPDESVQMCVTSPPYWSLRDYGIEPIVWDETVECDHEWIDGPSKEGFTTKARWQHTINGQGEGDYPSSERGRLARDKHPEAWGQVKQGDFCACGAWRGCLGLEPTPELYVSHIVQIFHELKRVLRSDGTLWLNLGDGYAGGGNGGGGSFAKDGIRRALPGTDKNKAHRYGSRGVTVKSKRIERGSGRWGGGNAPVSGDLKPKDLVGIPWMVAFALRADGWYLRSDIIWSKPNPMPESVTDRPTKSHEYIFLLSKSQRYQYNAEAIAEPVLQSSLVRAEAGVKFGGNNLCPDTRLQSGKEWIPKTEGRNSRMNVSRDPAHAHEYEGKHRAADDQASGRRILKNMKAAREAGGAHDAPFGVTRNKRTVWTIATAPFSDAHFATFLPDLVIPCVLAGSEPGQVVIDPFAGSGTTGKVAIELGRKVILIEPNEKYVEMIERRTRTTIGLPITA